MENEQRKHIKQDRANRLFGNTPIKKAIWIVVIPSLLTALMVGLYSFADTIFIQQFVPKTKIIFDTNTNPGEIYNFLPSLNIRHITHDEYYTLYEKYKNIGAGIPEINGNLIVSTANAAFQPLIVFSNSIVFLVPVGASIYYTKCIGKGYEFTGKNLWATMFWVCFSLSLLATLISFTLVGSGLIDSLAGRNIVDPNVVKDANERELLQAYYDAAHNMSVSWASQYVYIYASGTIIQGLSLFLSYFIRAEGYNVYTMGVGIGSNIINISLDAVFIIVLKQGVLGGVVATIIGWTFNLLMYVWYVIYLNIKGKSWLDFRKLFKFKFNKALLGPTFLLGASGFVRGFGTAIAFAVLNLLFTKTSFSLSGSYQFYLAKCMPVLFLFVMAIFGINDGARSLLSFNYVKRDFKRCREIYIWTLIVAVTYAVLSYILVTATAESVIVKVLNTTDDTKYEVAKFMRVMMLRIVFLSFSISSVLLFQGTNDIEKSLLSVSMENFICYLIIAPLSWLIGSLIFRYTGSYEWSNYAILIAFVVNSLISSMILFGFSWHYTTKKLPNIDQTKLSWSRKIEHKFFVQAAEYEKQFA
ncbi:hypothetical protein KQ878_00375 [Mycoplasma zalophidermidis]|uniref:Multidrug transporter MATE n=1 Tax=Mycoplasma zalophidermidis TaxID=398174 RepID=A0ABS6DQU9_9MOLU|nr:MATE family efflux transporter [Mycoplasma zalophidermidis]MBU4693341.1 hypothetical protein [Mycoplasma zalophidermidis]